ncbi:cell division protein FtsQ/DivIB [Kurthia sibirica]|uniref:Cell division protein DivIB n=1 Tax=Kurthia sibirica TaxID=202750 RepID=A0A2U3AQJ1_9BACL|nr:cell division protein FtsQ/DivIB [Kurthia sibirica]PWI26818.1 hypothetical protein DEX24_00535 [Kurthia sibirica]GEK32645.1 cell division protein DivIB [Kurthia sibirica]
MHKIIDIEERIPALKQRRKKRKNIRFFFLLFILALALLTLLYFQLPISHIKTIHVEGDKIQTKEFYIKHSGITEGDSLWSFDNKRVITSLENEATVKKATVHRSWLNSVDIKLVENRQVALIKDENRYNYVLENGETLLLNEPPTQFNLPILLNMSDGKVRKQLILQLQKLDPELVQLISQIESTPSAANNQSIRLYMNDGFEVRANYSNLASRLQYYPSIISQLNKEKKGVINLEIGGYYNSYKLEYK